MLTLEPLLILHNLYNCSDHGAESTERGGFERRQWRPTSGTRADLKAPSEVPLSLNGVGIQRKAAAASHLV